MASKGKAFIKGGLGCLAAFIVIAILALLVGGSAYIDIGGAIMLFVIGGLIGLGVNAIYNMGARGASRENTDTNSGIQDSDL